MVPVKPQIANKNNYGTKRSISNIKYIVVHYTGNDGDSDESNGKSWNICSVCGESIFHAMNFCPYCGADMRGEKE